MKKMSVYLCILFFLVFYMAGKVSAHGIQGLPSEVAGIDWIKSASVSNVYISSNFFVALDYDWTPDEYYWKTYHLIRSKGYSDRIAKDVCADRKAEYSAKYYATKPFSDNTIQFYVHSQYNNKDEKNAYMVVRISCDVANNRYREIEAHIFKKKDNGKVKIIQKSELKSDWMSISTNRLIEDSLKYYYEKGQS